jgi:signal peptidase I
MLALAWIPALVFASLVHLFCTMAGDLSSRPDMRAAAGRLKRSAYALCVGLAQALRCGLAPARDRPYPKWVGVVLGLVLAGSAHFLSGRKRAGLTWYFSILGCGLLSTGLLALPGSWAFFASMALGLSCFGLGLIVLVKSYRPVRRIGCHGWIALILLAVCLNAGLKSTTRLVVHPFNVSANAMEPTICGVRAEVIDRDEHPTTGLLARILWGRRYVRWEAAVSGTLRGPHHNQRAFPLWGYTVGSDVRWLPRSAERYLELGRRVAAGDLLFSGYVVSGDRVMVEKLSYMFRGPRRGEIVVFRTDGIQNLDAGEFYVKRVVGLPGEQVQIDPPYLVIDGQRVTEPPIFARIASQEQGYRGLQLAKHPKRRMLLDTTESEVVLGEDEYLVLGDNSENSYDSRMWGPVPRKNIIGRVTRIYWPLDRVNALEGKW